MNKTIITIIILLITLSLQAQDITSKLGGNTASETYDVTDSGDNVLLRVQGDGKVGIGTTSPYQEFHVQESVVGDATDVTDVLVVERNGNSNINIIASTTLNSGLLFSDNIRARGSIYYTHATDKLNFNTAGAGPRMVIDNGGDVGVGTASPTARLHVSGDDGLLVQGTYGNGITQNLGAGTRLHFYPKKAAFRAGWAPGNSWDDANIGNISVAMGYNTTASNSYSTAIGNSTTASGLVSTAMGESTKAESYISMAMGRFNVGGGTSGSWVSTDPLFEIGIGVSSGAKANAVTVLKNGNVGIGTVTPGAKLSIVGLSEYADNAAALIGGLIAGDLYRTGDLLKIVH